MRLAKGIEGLRTRRMGRELRGRGTSSPSINKLTETRIGEMCSLERQSAHKLSVSIHREKLGDVSGNGKKTGKS